MVLMMMMMVMGLGFRVMMMMMMTLIMKVMLMLVIGNSPEDDWMNNDWTDYRAGSDPQTENPEP